MWISDCVVTSRPLDLTQYVRNKLEGAVRGLTGADLKRAVLKALAEIREQLSQVH